MKKKASEFAKATPNPKSLPEHVEDGDGNDDKSQKRAVKTLVSNLKKRGR